LIAPPGFGKTTALVSYLRHTPTTGFYCSLMSGTTASGVRSAISRTLQVPGGNASFEGLLHALAAAGPLELALDCEGIPDATGLTEILRLINEAPEGVSLLIATRSRAAFDAGRLVTRGLACLCDVERLAFDATEVAQLARACGITFAVGDIPRLIERTDGWPQVISGAIRGAAEDGCALGASYENWRKRRGHLFNEFIATALDDASEEDATYVRKLMHGHRFDDGRESMQQLEREGLFVIHSDNEYRPLRPVSRVEAHHFAEPRTATVAPLKVQMLGWFHAEIGGREIKWIRKRDQQIFKYIALKPNGIATRAELSDAFWPGGEKQLVSQCLRTACSNIRKAIARIVGFNVVDSYFQVNGDVAIDSANVLVDVKTFIDFANDGDQEFEHGDRQAARKHYLRASELYRGDLLIGDRQEPWVLEPAAALQARRNDVLDRLAQSKSRAAIRASIPARPRLAAM
jgi:hypothetical protein